MQKQFLCGLGTLVTVALLAISLPDSEASAGWRHRRAGCGGHHGRQARHHRRFDGGGCSGGGYGNGGGYGGGCGEMIASPCGQGGYGGGCGEIMEPSCGAANYAEPYGAPMSGQQNWGGAPNEAPPMAPNTQPPQPNAPSGNNSAPGTTGTGDASTPPPPASPSDTGA